METKVYKNFSQKCYKSPWKRPNEQGKRHTHTHVLYLLSMIFKIWTAEEVKVD
jgi:hypothetical protein